MAAPTTQQLLTAIAALARSFTLPSVNGNQTGIFNGNSNALQIPINALDPYGAYNTQLGSKLNITADANYIYIGTNVGDATSGF